MADARAREALDRIARGEQVPRRELKRPYNGAEGVPIREEIVERHGDVIITRNSYGALCLNTPNVLFADIDFSLEPIHRLALFIMGLLLCGAILLGWTVDVGWGCAAAAAALLLAWPLAGVLYRLWTSLAGGPEQQARGRLAGFLSAHPDWHVRLYRTPGGLRVLAMQQTFDPNEPRVAECFAALGVDPIYARMCQRQHCFRARVSPKPWRIGIGEHLKPRPGVWPIHPDRLPQRRRWTEIYERAARSFASCSFLESLGSGASIPPRPKSSACTTSCARPIARCRWLDPQNSSTSGWPLFSTTTRGRPWLSR